MVGQLTLGLLQREVGQSSVLVRGSSIGPCLEAQGLGFYL